METIKIFLASSEELSEDRVAFKSFIDNKNKILQSNGVFIYLDIWEDFIDAVSTTRSQDEYNKAVVSSDIFVMLFSTKVGKYTEEEFDKALEKFKATGKPFIYTYFKNANVEIEDIEESDLKSLRDFQKKLDSIGHFFNKYKTSEQLVLHFSQQLEKLNKEGHINLYGSQNSINPAPNTPICLSAGQPSVTADFIGRELELADVKEKLKKHSLLLINAEGGMGKTTLAAKYLDDNIANYTHYAWLFCDTGITEQLKTLASPLGIDLSQYATEDEQLLAIKTKLENLSKNCLIVLDNANEPGHIEDLKKYFDGLHTHILITSRCRQVLPKEKEYTLDHLKPDVAKQFFKSHYDEKTIEFETLIEKFLIAVGYNTLMIELFSKNLHELSALGETLETILKHFEKEGLYLGNKSFEIQTEYTSNVHKQAASTDDIINVIYDLTKLQEPERYLLVNLALLPAESHQLKILLEAFAPEDDITFTKLLKNLVKKGWLNTDTHSYRMNPVIQQIALVKNKKSLYEDATKLISILTYKIEHTDGSLANLKNYQQAQPFAVMAQSLSMHLSDQSFETGMLVFNLSDYYKGIGNFIYSVRELRLATDIFKINHKENYCVCFQRLGDIYQNQGDLEKALHFFEKYNELGKELIQENSNSESLKLGLAISYEKLGGIYEQRGDFTKALQFFEQDTKLMIELVEVNPQSESLKNGLAVSYSRLGQILLKQGYSKKALQFFEKYNELKKELVEANPHNESYKNGLAISFGKLAGVYQQQGDLKKALQFLENETVLTRELFDANPHSESLKNGLAVSYSKLGDFYKELGDYKKSLQFFEQDIELTKELFEANPRNEWIKHSLAISYEKLGGIYDQQGDLQKALQFFEQETLLMKELFDVNPHSESIKHGLAISYEKLGGIYNQYKDFKKALEFFEQETLLMGELFDANPDSESLKNGLAISYGNLGNIYQQQEDLQKALQFYIKYNELRKELMEDNPDSVSICNGMAVSFAKLGLIYKEIQNLEKAKDNFLKAEAIWIELTEKVPEAVAYPNNLRWVKELLASL